MRLRRRLCLISLLALFFLHRKDTIHATREFDIHSKVVYTINTQGTTSVTHTVGLTNKLPSVYATEYAITVGSTRLRNAWARDGVGFLSPTLTTTSNTTTVAVQMKEKSAGVGQTLSLSVGYEDQDIVSKIGRVWEINIPHPEDITEFMTYDVVLIVPTSIGDPVQMVPEPVRRSDQREVTIYEFSKEELIGRGITAIFGQNQVFSFDLRYTLENPSPMTRVMQVALPPDTSYQRIIFDRIVPEPKDIEMDRDGNWLASFKVERGGTLEIHAVGNAIISLTPSATFHPDTPPEAYLTAESPWQVDDPQIQDLAKRLKTPRQIYDFVIETLEYNFSRVQASNVRLGAKEALANPNQAICMEFTDLFIALARAAGIPARELNGFAYTENPNLRPLSLRQDILHAWPEYFDAQRDLWIPVDPTWGDTTQGIDYFSRFDLNHVVFAIHGSSPSFPYPAGFYKTATTQGKDITVIPVDVHPPVEANLQLHLELKQFPALRFSRPAWLSIRNSGNSAVHNTSIKLEALGFAILSPIEQPLPVLLPYSEVKLPLVIENRALLQPLSGRFGVEIAGVHYETEVSAPSVWFRLSQWLLALGLGAGIAAVASQTRRLLLPFATREGPLRRSIR